MAKKKKLGKRERFRLQEINTQRQQAVYERDEGLRACIVKAVLSKRRVDVLPCSWSQAAKVLKMDVQGLISEDIERLVKSRLIRVLNSFEREHDLSISYPRFHFQGKRTASSLTSESCLPGKLEVPFQFRSKGSGSDYQLAPLKLSGIETQLNPDAENDNELTIGLDFGTSSVKVAVRDLGGTTFLVPFGASNSAQKYLLPTRVYEQDGIFSLSEGSEVWRDLKLTLISSTAGDRSIVLATAFLALVLRRVRAWLFENYRSLYKSDYLVWGINVGLPAASYDDHYLVNVFRQVGLAAANLSADNTELINEQKTLDYLRRATEEIHRIKKGKNPSDMPIMSDMVDVVPEIAAQISGYVRSDCWDRKNTMMMLVDIGAGTVDSSVFTVMKPEQHQFAFLSSSVEPLGVMNLHRMRVDWLKRKISDLDGNEPFIQYLDSIHCPTDRLQGVPESWKDYIKGLRLIFDRSADDDFYTSYRGQLFNKVITPGRQSNPRTLEWRELPFFLCGGGKNMGLYKKFIESINSDQNNSIVRLKPMPISRPPSLIAKGVRQKDYHRFSVAYGLSYSRDLIGKCIPTAAIPPLNRRSSQRAKKKKGGSRRRMTVCADET